MSADIIDIFLYFKKISPLIHKIYRVYRTYGPPKKTLYVLRMIVKLAYSKLASIGKKITDICIFRIGSNIFDKCV